MYISCRINYLKLERRQPYHCPQYINSLLGIRKSNYKFGSYDSLCCKLLSLVTFIINYVLQPCPNINLNFSATLLTRKNFPKLWYIILCPWCPINLLMIITFIPTSVWIEHHSYLHFFPVIKNNSHFYDAVKENRLISIKGSFYTEFPTYEYTQERTK